MLLTCVSNALGRSAFLQSILICYFVYKFFDYQGVERPDVPHIKPAWILELDEQIAELTEYSKRQIITFSKKIENTDIDSLLIHNSRQRVVGRYRF